MPILFTFSHGLLLILKVYWTENQRCIKMSSLHWQMFRASHGLKETPRRIMTVTSSSNEMAADELEIGSVLKSVLNNELNEFPYYPLYFMVPV
jgi:hypothetical protein